jgi:hypothetical protein
VEEGALKGGNIVLDAGFMKVSEVGSNRQFFSLLITL